MVFYSNTTLDNYGSITIDQQLRTQDPTAVIYNHPGATIVNNKLLNVGPGLLVNDSLIENNDDLTNEEGGEIHQLCSGSITGNAVIGTPPVDVCDTTPPIIVSSVTGDLGNDGWYTGLLLVSWSISDPDGLVLSQLGCGTSSVVVDTPGYTQTCMATSYGGTTSVDVTVKRDATAPVVSAAMSPGPNGHGWNHSDVTVTFSATDNLSGVASCDAPITISAEGAGQSASGTCIDVAGSTSSATASGINVDKTVPVVAFSGNAGTYGLGDTINIGCSATDALSGVLSSICPSVTGPAYTFDTSVTHTLYASADDLAGNADSASTSFVIEVTEDGVDSVIKALFENPNAAAKLEKQLDKALGASVNKQPKELAKVEDLVQKNVDKGRLTQEEADLILELLAVLSE